VLPVARLRERLLERALLRRERLLLDPRLRLLPALRERLLLRRERLLLDLLAAIRFSSYRDLDRRDRRGTFAPLRRALLSPIAMACLRFFTRCLPERMWCISVRTSLCALRLYLRPRVREREVERCDRELRRVEELRLRGICLTSPYQTQGMCNGLATHQPQLRIRIAACESKSAALTFRCFGVKAR
jgi:hypothetical protein